MAAATIKVKVRGSVRVFVYYKRLVEFLVADEVVFEVAFGLRGLVLDHGVVDLAAVALLEDFVHAREGLAGLGEEDDAADGTVEAMDDTTEDIARLAVALLEESLDFVGHAGVASLVALDNLAGALVDGDEVVVFVEDVHW